MAVQNELHKVRASLGVNPPLSEPGNDKHIILHSNPMAQDDLQYDS